MALSPLTSDQTLLKIVIFSNLGDTMGKRKKKKKKLSITIHYDPWVSMTAYSLLVTMCLCRAEAAGQVQVHTLPERGYI